MTLTGAPGVGKSRLAVEAARSLEADPGRHLARRIHLGGWCGRRRPPRTRRRRSRLRSARARDFTASPRSGSPRSRRVRARARRAARGSRRLSSRSVPRPGSWRRAARRSIANEVKLPVAPLEAAAVELSSSVRARHDPDSSQTTRPSRSPPNCPARRRIAAGDRARRHARERARSRRNRLHPRAASSAPARQPGLGLARTALQGLVEWSYDLLHEDEKTLLQQLAAGARPAVARRARSEAAASASRLSRISLPRWSTSRSCRPRSPAAPPATTCSIRSVSTCSSVSPRATGSPPAARTPNTSRHSPTRRASSCGPDWLRWERRLELENDNLWAALAYARDAPDLPSRCGSALGWYFALADRVSGPTLPRARPLCHGR